MNQEKTIVFLGDADQRENVEETKDRKACSICRGPVQVEGRSFQAEVYIVRPQHPQGVHVEHEGALESFLRVVLFGSAMTLTLTFIHLFSQRVDIHSLLNYEPSARSVLMNGVV
jgi:hypothetical protein